MADDQDQGSGNDQTDVDVDKVDDAGTDDADQNNDAGDDSDSGDDSATVSKAQFDKLFARMQAADRAKNAAEQKLKSRDEQDMSEIDRVKSQLESEKTAREAAEGRLKAMVVENAFHRENKFSWHDVGDAIAALDLSTVEVDEDGKVTGMASAIKDVAKRKPHYVQSKQQDDGDGTNLPAANGASNGKRKGDRGATDAKALTARFPALGK